MSRRQIVLILVLCSLFPASSGKSQSRELRFEERVAAQHAIERVYYIHQTGAKIPFEKAFPEPLLERKVRDYLKQSAALELFYGKPITAEMLRGENERMARQTRMPGRLRELYAALENDPILIQECLVRPALVSRILRSSFASDPSIHASARQVAEGFRRNLAEGTVDPYASRPGRTLVTLRRRTSAGSNGEWGNEHLAARFSAPIFLDLAPEDFERWERVLPATPGTPTPVLDEHGSFSVYVPLARRPGEIDIASYAVPKITWDDWWSRKRAELDENKVRTVAVEAPIPVVTDAAGCATDSWGTFGDLQAPDVRSSHTAVWTGSVMIIWGGYSLAQDRVNTGGRYDPVTDTWSPTSLANAPSPRSTQVAVWTGARMLVWGGENRLGLNTGGQYDPLTDTWSSITTQGAPSPRAVPAAVWTGSHMIVWGGSNNDGLKDTGGVYDPVGDTWLPTTTTNAPTARYGHTGVWTGSEMAIWGGTSSGGATVGGLYNPQTDTWRPIATANAPTDRYYHSAVWTGSRMIVWGGQSAVSGSRLDTGGLYDPVTDQWTPMTGENPPSPRRGHTAVWTNSQMLVWGGSDGGSPLNSGGLYDPETDTWSSMALSNAPAARSSHTAVWTGRVMIVWGGEAPAGVAGAAINTGGRFDPAVNSWTPTYTGDVPYPRTAHTAVWTGSLLVIWGGLYNGSPGIPYLNSGGRYDPATDTWQPTALAGAPSAREGHSAIWTGSRMIVWGGGGYLGTGGQYDPLADVWTPVSTINAPSPRRSHSAVWTGSRMVIWGGGDANYFNTGGRYDPDSDTWAATSLTGAPSPRGGHSAVWTGSQMIIWSGTVDSSGGSYDPVADSWTPTSTLGAPSGRRFHGAVWTGSQMLVWGGNLGFTVLGDGGRYDPITDTWIPMTLLDAPSARTNHATLWDGEEMLVWGGASCISANCFLNSGARYDPGADLWTAVTTTNAPSARARPGAAWTGSLMLVWGGSNNYVTGGLGYAYCGCISKTYYRDSDDDRFGDPAVTTQACSPPEGYIAIAGDCNDAAGDLWRMPGEVGGLQVASDRKTLFWSEPADPGATNVAYDVLKSVAPSDFTDAGVCLASGAPGRFVLDPELPLTGDALFYLVRALNGCPLGQGTLGYTSDGTPRIGLDCP